jgi:multicomponent Na+:H+ antiporter subunit A
MAYVALLFIFKLFLGKSWDDKNTHEVSLLSWLSPLFLALSIFYFVSFGSKTFFQNINFAANSILPSSFSLEPLSWKIHFNFPLLLSAIVYCVAVLLLKYFYHHKDSREDRLRFISDWGFTRFYNLNLASLIKISKKIFSFVQHGYFPSYIRLFFISLLCVCVFSFWPLHLDFPNNLKDVWIVEWVIGLLIVGGAVLALLTSNVLAALLSLGLVGFGIAALYALWGAPDLALTQFLVESLTLILLVLIFQKLPRDFTRTKKLSFDTKMISILAALVAFFISYESYYAAFEPERAQIRKYFGDFSFLLAHGRNVVNVIIVDFRGLDTMGEITVLTVAAIGVYALLSAVKFSKKEASRSQ